MNRVLVVDDDIALARALTVILRAHGLEVTACHDGRAALSAITGARFDVIVLDLGLPDIDGMEVLTGIRGWSQVPVVVLSARSDSAEKVAALNAGADDYVTKPFGMDELLARIRAAIRRGQHTDDPVEPRVSTDHFTVDLSAHQVIDAAGTPIRLTPTEWNILDVLVRNAGKMVPNKQLLTEVWGPVYEQETHYLRVYLAQLRRKLEPNPAQPRYLLTEPGMGYRFTS